jgi:hypothetical protein
MDRLLINASSKAVDDTSQHPGVKKILGEGASRPVPK